MKKTIFFLLCLFVAVVFTACQNDDDSLSPTASKVKVFMSCASQTRGAADGGRQAIKQGDTVDVKDVKDINVVLLAEAENGDAVDGTWSFFNIDNDLDISNDTIAIGAPGGSTAGSAMSTKLSTLGLYVINFQPKNGEKFVFYIRHTGTPGIVGDGFFRLGKGKYQANNAIFGEGYTMYLKYRDGEFPSISEDGVPNPSLQENWRALVTCANNIFTSQGGVTYSAKEFCLKKCKYSPGYVCFSLLTKIAPAINGEYKIYFYSGTFGNSWWSFSSVEKSDWSIGNQIVFKTI